MEDDERKGEKSQSKLDQIRVSGAAASVEDGNRWKKK